MVQRRILELRSMQSIEYYEFPATQESIDKLRMFISSKKHPRHAAHMPDFRLNDLKLLPGTTTKNQRYRRLHFINKNLDVN